MRVFKLCLMLSLVANFLLADRIITDQLGREVKVPDVVNRVVVLQHHTINLVNQLDGFDKVVGVSKSWSKHIGQNYSRLAPNIVNLPMPGDLKSINYESILSLKPDVVLIPNFMPKEYIKKLEMVKVPVFAVSYFVYSGVDIGKRDHDVSTDEGKKAYDEGYYDAVRLVAKLINKEQNGEELIKFVKAQQKDLKKLTSKLDFKHRKTIYMANPNYHTYGKGKYTNIIFERGGGENIAARYIKGFKSVSAENILQWNPDVIFIQERYPFVKEELLENKTLKSLNAIKNNQIFILPEFAKTWGHPTAEAMSLGEIYIAKKLYPNELKEYDLDAKIKEFYKKFYRFEYDGK